MPAPTAENASIEADIEATFTTEEAFLTKEHGLSPEQAHGALLNLKKRGRLSLNQTIGGKNVDEFQSHAARQLWNGVASAAREKMAKSTSKSKKTKDSWWHERLAKVIMSRNVRNSGPGKRKVGEITDVALASNTKVGKAKTATEAEFWAKKMIALAEEEKKKAADEVKARLAQEEEKFEYLKQQIGEWDDEEEMNQTMTDSIATLQKLLGKFNKMTYELKECVVEGVTECVDFGIDLVARIDNGEDITSATVKAFNEEHSNLLKIANGDVSTADLKTYRHNLGARKRSRGRDLSENAQMVRQQLLDAKRVFDEEKKVLHKELHEEFPEEEYPGFAKNMKEALRAHARGDEVTTIAGVSNVSTLEEATRHANEKIERLLRKAAKYKNLKGGAEAFLPSNCDTIPDLLNMPRDKPSFDRLKKEALRQAQEWKESLPEQERNGVKAHDPEILSLAMLNSTLGVLNSHDDLRDMLLQQIAIAIQNPATKRLMTFLHIPYELALQLCIGAVKAGGMSLDQFNDTLHVKGDYFLEVFSEDEYPRMYKVDGNTVKRIHFCVLITDNLFTFQCHTARDKEFESERKYENDHKPWSLHRLHGTVFHNLGLGLNNRDWYRDYFDLKKDETFEATIGYYQYYPELLEQRKKRLEAKGWTKVKQAVLCDEDHLLGRLCAWMNSSIFTMSCSHSWNQCIMNVRQRMGCWGFCFANIKYNGGN